MSFPHEIIHRKMRSLRKASNKCFCERYRSLLDDISVGERNHSDPIEPLFKVSWVEEHYPRLAAAIERMLVRISAKVRSVRHLEEELHPFSDYPGSGHEMFIQKMHRSHDWHLYEIDDFAFEAAVKTYEQDTQIQ